MALEMETDRVICARCGKTYPRRRGFFKVSYAACHKGLGYITICSDCIDAMYNTYLAQCNNARDAVRQMCRKLDLYWNESAFESIEKKSTTRTILSRYIQRINTTSYAGKCYDDTLSNEGTLWNFNADTYVDTNKKQAPVMLPQADKNGDIPIEDISEDVITYWGPGYTPEMYQDLEQRRTYWVNNLPDGIVLDVGMEARIRQICNLELDINRMRADGKATDKQAAQLSKLISDMNLDPASRGEDNTAFDKTPFGVWIDRWENKRPVPEPDQELKDVDHIVRYISTWLLGHLCAMFGIKNKNTKLYESAIAEMRVEKKVSDDEDDEEIFNLVFPSKTGDDR